MHSYSQLLGFPGGFSAVPDTLELSWEIFPGEEMAGARFFWHPLWQAQEPSVMCLPAKDEGSAQR